jgi:signal transduction histidine kinase
MLELKTEDEEATRRRLQYSDGAWQPVPVTLPEEVPLAVFVNGEEHYFRPEAIPILGRDTQPTGVVLVLQDVTQERKQEELKRGVISTVSHQLKSPLTSIRMAIHLLLEEKTEDSKEPTFKEVKLQPEKRVPPPFLQRQLPLRSQVQKPIGIG